MTISLNLGDVRRAEGVSTGDEYYASMLHPLVLTDVVAQAQGPRGMHSRSQKQADRVRDAAQRGIPRENKAGRRALKGTLERERGSVRVYACLTCVF